MIKLQGCARIYNSGVEVYSKGGGRVLGIRQMIWEPPHDDNRSQDKGIKNIINILIFFIVFLCSALTCKTNQIGKNIFML